MWKIIGIPLALYLIFVFYVYQPSAQQKEVISAAKLIEELPIDTVKVYIESSAPLAIQEMRRAQIPASITLAQAILESKYGTSELAKQANNHFGIKVQDQMDSSKHCLYSNEWDHNVNRMRSMLCCFRKYKKKEDCYINHSDFLTQRPYYTGLFKLQLKDYKAWAKGLQAAGYATDPQYAQKLIAVIERYQLYNYDDSELTT